uniref:Ig-like domain-containing protein n=1 Tax=Naja naja TaxID=35670 RepID=A0A8C6VHK6_NAJNA
AVKTAPTVFPLSPCNQDIATTSQVSIGCLVKGYFPEPAAVQWNSVLLGSNHYTHSSLLTIPVSQWQSQSFQCNVHHAATDTRINKIIDRESSKPHRACPQSGPCRPSPRQPIRSQRPDQHQARSRPPTPRSKVPSGCGSSCPSGNVNVYLVPPIPRALYIDRNSKISCFVNNLQNEQGLKITWSREKNGHLNVDLLETVEEPNGTYTVVSRLNVIAQDWESGESFTCTVEHPSFVSPVIKNIFKTRGNKKAPKVYVFPPHRDELNPGRSLSLVCMADGFYPEDIDIQWLQDHNPVSEDQYVTTPAMKNKHDDSFFAVRKLSIPREDWNGESYTFMVVHEELPMKFTQRNISKPWVKMNQCSVSILPRFASNTVRPNC